MADTWSDIVNWLKESAPPVFRDLRAGASADEISEVENTLGRRLGTAVKAMYLANDGQEGGAPGVLGEWTIFPLETVLREWRLMNELLDNGTFGDNKTKSDGKVKAVWWSRGWIPLTGDGAGNHRCLDTDPADGGQPEQIITFWHADAIREALFPNLDVLLADFKRVLLAGELQFVDDEWLTAG